MATAIRLPVAPVSYRNGVIVSIMGHLALLAAFSSSLILIPQQPMPQLAIEAVLVDPKQLRPAPTVPPKPDPQQQRAERERQQRLEQERQQAELKRQQEAKAATERRQADERREAEQQRKADQQRKDSEVKAQAAAEQQRKQAEADRVERERKAAEDKARVEQERRAAEERARAEAERQQQAKRQAELMAAMEAEEALAQAASSGELARYLALIQQKVERNWVPPPSAREGLECEVAVQQLPNGDVVDARTVSL